MKKKGTLITTGFNASTMTESTSKKGIWPLVMNLKAHGSHWYGKLTDRVEREKEEGATIYCPFHTSASQRHFSQLPKWFTWLP